MRRNWITSLAAVAVLAVGIAACGSSDDGGEESNVATEASSSIQVEPRDVGVVNLVRQSPSEDKIDRLYAAMGEALGWNVEIIDGGGDPAKITRSVQNFINKDYDAVITTSTEASILRSQLKDAKAKDIPVINTNGGTTPSDLYTAQYEEDEKKLGTELAQYMADTIDDPKIGDLATSIAYSGVVRDDVLKAQFGDAIVDRQEVDLTNPVADTEAKLTSMLTANPDINAVWAVYDNMAQAAVSTIDSKNSDAKLYTYFTTEQNVKNLRADTAMEAVADVDAGKTGAVAFDQLLALFQNKEPINPDAMDEFPLKYEVVSRENVEEMLGDNPELFTNESILQPFLDKWSKEYGG